MLMHRMRRLVGFGRSAAQFRLFYQSSRAVDREPSSLVSQIHRKDDERMLHVQWEDKSVSRFPYLYLRDICPCSSCQDQTTLERKCDTVEEIDLDVCAKDINVLQDGIKIRINWPDNHVTELDSNWLHSKRLPEEQEKRETLSIARKGVRFWNRKDLQGKIPRFGFDKIMKEDEVLFEWLNTLHTIGIALVDDAPRYTDPISCYKLSRRVGYIKSTHYGHTFDVHAKFDANNLAYTTGALPLHCDIPQSEYYPGVQFLHCLEQVPTEGGANMFVDGFHVAQEFKSKEPELFHLLATTLVPYVDIGRDAFGDFHLEKSRPVIELDHTQKITRYTYNNHVRDYHLSCSPKKVVDVYRGYMLLGKMMRDGENRIDHKLSPGEMMTFNNSRVLHGRDSYKPTEGGQRHLQGVYLDWDLIYARLRSLGQAIGRPFDG